MSVDSAIMMVLLVPSVTWAIRVSLFSPNIRRTPGASRRHSLHTYSALATKS